MIRKKVIAKSHTHFFQLWRRQKPVIFVVCLITPALVQYGYLLFQGHYVEFVYGDIHSYSCKLRLVHPELMLVHPFRITPLVDGVLLSCTVICNIAAFLMARRFDQSRNSGSPDGSNSNSSNNNYSRSLALIALGDLLTHVPWSLYDVGFESK